MLHQMPRDHDLFPAIRSLSELGEGGRARIREIRGGRNVTRRLLSLGLRIGTEVRVVQRRGGGVVVANEGNRVALGAGVADKLIVDLLN